MPGRQGKKNLPLIWLESLQKKINRTEMNIGIRKPRELSRNKKVV